MSDSGGAVAVRSYHSSDDDDQYPNKVPRDQQQHPRGGSSNNNSNNNGPPPPGQLTSEMNRRPPDNTAGGGQEGRGGGATQSPPRRANSNNGGVKKDVKNNPPQRSHSPPPSPTNSRDNNNNNMAPAEGQTDQNRRRNPSPPQSLDGMGGGYGGRAGGGRSGGGGQIISASEHRSRLNDDDEYYARISSGEAPSRGGGGGGGRRMVIDDDEYSTHGDPRGPGTQPPPQRHSHIQGTATPTSETLNLAEQEFLAKYGYSNGAGGGGNNYSNPRRARSAPRETYQNNASSGQSVASFESSIISRPNMDRIRPEKERSRGGGSSARPPPSIGPRNNASSGESVATFDTRESSIISRPNMPRMQNNDGSTMRPDTERTRGGRPARPPPSIGPRNNASSGESVATFDTRDSSIISRPNMARMQNNDGPPPPSRGDRRGDSRGDPRGGVSRVPHGGGDPRDRNHPPVIRGSGQSVTSQMSESIISNPAMHRMGNGSDPQHHHQQQRMGERPPSPRGRTSSPPRAADRFGERPPPERRNLYERVQQSGRSPESNYNNPPHQRPTRHRSGGSYEQGEGVGGGIYPRVERTASGGHPRRSSYNDDYGGDRGGDYGGGASVDRGQQMGGGGGGGGASIERGMDDRDYPRRGIQRIPSQSTISTSGFRSFYSEAFTKRDRDSDSVSTDYRHHYGGPPTVDGSRYSIASRSSYGNDHASYDSRADSRGYGGGGGGSYYGQGPPSYNQQNQQNQRSGNSSYGRPPGGGGGGGGGSYSRDYSPHHQPPPPQQHFQQHSQPDRPLLEVAPGLLMHLMGTDETMKAIQRGQITVTSCVVCGMDIHCHSESEYVLCPDCRVVSPVNQLDNVDMTPQQGGLVGLGVKTEMLLTMMEAAGNKQY